jgi:hypothetical protein
MQSSMIEAWFAYNAATCAEMLPRIPTPAPDPMRRATSRCDLRPLPRARLVVELIPQRRTADLRRMAEWLKRCGIRTEAMQSTGVYWVAVQEILEREGFKVCLVNARGTKNLPGRKSDVQECQWLMKLHTYGLLRSDNEIDDRMHAPVNCVIL